VPRPSFTSIFKLIAALACFAAPWVVGDYYLQRISPYWENLESLRKYSARDLTASTVAIGDCTIIPLRYFADNSPKYAHLRVFGFGGSAVKEWYYLVKNLREKMSTAKAVVIGVSPPERYKQLTASYTSQLPFLMTWSDIFHHSLTEKRIFFAETIRFLLAKQFESFSASQVMRFKLFDAIFPYYKNWYDQRNFFVGHPQVEWRAQSKENPLSDDMDISYDENDYFARLAEISKSMSGRLVFMITPRSSWRNADAGFRKGVDQWLEQCRKLNVVCYDMSRTMPDEYFDRPPGDGLHLNSEKSRMEFWEKFEAELRRTGKLDSPKYSAR